MSNIDATKYAGQVLKVLIKENYQSQEEFAYEFGVELRTLSRYVNEGIGQVWRIQEFAEFFGVQMTVFCPVLPKNDSVLNSKERNEK